MTNPESITYEELVSRGLATGRAGDSAQAIECFQRASVAQPAEGLPQFLLGAEFAALGDIAQAEAAFANATRLAPGFPMARYQLGLLQFSSGRAAMALLTWEPLLQLAESDPLPHFVRGFAALANDQFEAALQHFLEGLPLNTDNPALASDIEKVIAGIRAVATDLGDRSQDSAASDAHILLANYQQQGRAH